MTFLEKIELLMIDKNINKRQLSIGSDIPYSTIDNLWKKGYENIKLSNLKKIACYFGVSLDFLVRDDIDDPAIGQDFLSDHEKRLIAAYREKKDMRAAVDTLLGISGDSAPKIDSSNNIAADEAATVRAANNAFIAVHTKQK